MNTMRTGYSLSLFLTITIFSSTQAVDTINISQILRDNGTTLISPGGIFELGFYSPVNSKNRYVGIWYKKIAVKAVVWVANRDNPLKDTSGTLKLVEPGVLALLNGTNGIIWSTTASTTLQNPVSQLLDSGNLVVKDANPENPENFVWQSFDYPTNTHLPGMKLGWNFLTGLEVYITSPKSSDNPSSGDYTYHCDPTGYPQNVIKKGASVLYRTKPWAGISSKGGPNPWNNNIYTLELVMNENEVYFHYELINKSVLTRFTLSESGVGQTWIWVDRAQNWVIYLTIPRDDCDNYKACGPYGSCNINNSPICGCLERFIPKDPQSWDKGDWSSGCIRRSPLNCESDGDYLRYSGIKLPDTKHSWFNMSTLSLQECRVLCLKNCSCTAYASLYVDGSGCLLWSGDLVDIRVVSPGQDIYIRMASSDLDNGIKSERKKRGVIIVTLSLVIGITLVCLSMFLYTQKRKKMDNRRQGTSKDIPRRNNKDESQEDLQLPFFTFSKITKATDNFSTYNKLGQGGFGPVYKGVLEEGQEVAVKCLSRSSHQGVDEFKNEVICIAKLQHRNLVKLLGWCIHGEEMMLVYEYMANKSLDLLLFDPTKSMLLDWPKRFNIIIGIARGIMYLHQDSRLRVIHRDLKASNILLDSDLKPKISDFGLARTFQGSENEAKTNKIVGTYGYISPEYAVNGLFSAKSDVFSYGVIVLEIVSGKRNRGFSHTDQHLSLIGYAWKLYKQGRSSELVDPCLKNSCHLTEVLRYIHIGLLCVQESPHDRPSMSSVIPMLSSDDVLPEAKHPGFFPARGLLKSETPVSSNTTSSKNAMTTSLLEPR